MEVLQAAVSSVAQTQSDPSPAPPTTTRVTDCYNQFYNETPQVLGDYLSGQLPSLFLHRVLGSKRRDGPPLTLLAVATRDDLENVEALCAEFPGPFVVALYMPLIEPPAGPAAAGSALDSGADGGGGGVRPGLRRRAVLTGGVSADGGDTAALSPASRLALKDLSSAAQALLDRTEAKSGGCSLRLLLLAERLADPQLAALPPANALRNAAALAARTPLVAAVGPDMALSGTVRALLADEARMSQMADAAAAGTAFVVPSWEAAGDLELAARQELAAAALKAPAGAGRGDLAALAAAGQLVPLAGRLTAETHGRWLAAEAPFPVRYEDGYDPVIIADRMTLMPYDERFRACQYDRAAQAAAMHYMARTNLMVLHDVWLVRRPQHMATARVLSILHGNTGDSRNVDGLLKLAHAGTEPDKLTNAWSSAHSVWGHVFHLYTSGVVQRAREGRYAPVAAPRWGHCRASLAWWRRAAQQSGAAAAGAA